MKSIAILAVGLLLGALGMFLSTNGAPPAAADCQDNPCANPPCCNGDVNKSGMIDIADAIYLLTYLFSHGPEPVAIESTGGALPATGQMTCYWPVGCDDPDYPGQDGSYRKGCPTAGRFIDNGDETVTDACTGLMWQKSTAQGLRTWQQALQYCQNLSAAGYSDWRLPNVLELLSIINFGEDGMALYEPVFSSWYSGTYSCWSSTFRWPGGDEHAWCVDFAHPRLDPLPMSTTLTVWAVRG